MRAGNAGTKGGFAAAVLGLLGLAPGAVAEDGWRPLFDGKSLAGWSGDPSLWSVQDGTITGRTTAAAPIAHNTFLVHEEEFGDFELRLEVRIESGNSGIQYRSRVIDAAEHVVGGLQADLCAPTPGNEWITGICYDERGRGILARRGQAVTFPKGGQKEVMAFATEEEFLETFAGKDWHQIVIRASGPHLTQTYDGRRTVELHDADAPARGVIAFQLHMGEPMKVQFRNVQIRSLSDGDDDGTANAMVDVPVRFSEVWNQDPWDVGPQPRWIWLAGQPTAQHCVLRRRFEAHGESVRLKATCDNGMEVLVNGKSVVKSNDWASPVDVALDPFLVDGENVLEVRCDNEGPVAGFAAKVVQRPFDVEPRVWVSDSSFEARAPDSDRFAPAAVVGTMGDGPWGELFSPRSVALDRVQLRPGFELEELHRVSKDVEGSWVSITPDPREPGVTRFFVSDQYGPLFTVTPGADPKSTVVHQLATPVGKAHGLLYAFGSLYVMGAGPEGTGFYRLFDRDGDGEFEEHHLLAAIDVGSEHGAHAIVLSPDGRSLYLVAGNMTRLPERTDPDSPRHRWANDFLLPAELEPSGHNNDGKPVGGFVLHTDPEGSHFVQICGGFRNPYDMAFDRFGELFVYDSDMEYDGGAPWYRPTRVVHALPGADFGWRRGAGKWAPYAGDSLGSVIDIGQGSPTGVVFGYGTKFPARYQDALFLCDWTYGRIRAVHLQPSGASYQATAEDFVVGRPLPLTDVAIGADGAMYFLVGGRRTQSKFFRLRYTGDESTAPSPLPTLDPVTVRSTEARHELEALHHPVGPSAVEEAWPFLGSRDRALRLAARVALEHQPFDLWRDRALSEERPRTRITAMLAFARTAPVADREVALRALNGLPLQRLRGEDQTDLLRAYELVFVRLDADSAEAMSLDEHFQKFRAARTLSPAEVAARSRFEALFPTGERDGDREMAKLLVYLHSPKVVAPAVEKMVSTPVQEEAMFYASILRLVDQGWSHEDRVRFFTWTNKGLYRLSGSQGFDAGGYFRYEGGRSFRPYVEVIQRRAIENVPAEMTLDPQLVALWEAKESVGGEETHLELQMQPRAWQMADLAAALPRARSGRDFETGRAAFRGLRCAECHAFPGNVARLDLGPDLTTAGSRFSAADLLESILEPSKEISDQYADHVVWTKTGRMISGSLVEQTADEMVIRPDPEIDETVRIAKSEVEEVGLSKISKMPVELLNYLTEEQILDLLAYVLCGGDAQAPCYQKSE